MLVPSPPLSFRTATCAYYVSNPELHFEMGQNFLTLLRIDTSVASGREAYETTCSGDGE